jgi:hypothetical protein
MKTIFTYPNNLATDYIDPNYLGDNNSGFYQRSKALLNGTYKGYLNQLGTVPGTANINETIQRMSYYHDAFLEPWGENTIYQYWNQPLIEASIDRINIPLTSSDTALDPTPITFTVPATPPIIDGELLDCNNFDSTLISLNNNSYYAKVISSTEIQLSVNSGLTKLLNYRIGAIDTVSSVTGGSTADWNPALLTSNGYGSNGLVFLSEFDGTLAKYNDQSLYLNVVDSNTFNLSWDYAGTDLLSLQNMTQNNLTSIIIDADAGTIPTGLADRYYYGRTWDTDFKFGVSALTSATYKGAKISEGGVTNLSLLPATVSKDTAGAQNNYWIPTVSRDAQTVVYQSDTSQDQVLEWTGTGYEISSNFTWPTPASPPQKRLYGTGTDGRFLWVNTDAVDDPNVFSSKVYDLQNAVTPKAVTSDINSVWDPMLPKTPGQPYRGITDGMQLVFPQGSYDGSEVGYDAFLCDPGGNRFFVITNSAPLSDDSVELVPVIKTTVGYFPTGGNYLARQGDQLSASGKLANGSVRVMTTAFARVRDYGGGTTGLPVLHNMYEINYSVPPLSGAPTATLLSTLTQNLNVNQTISMNWFNTGNSANLYPDSVCQPKLSRDGTVYVIGGVATSGISFGGLIQIYRYANGTWTTNDNDIIQTGSNGDVRGLSISEDNNRIIAQTGPQAITTYEYSTNTNSWVISDQDYVTSNQWMTLNASGTDNPRSAFGAATIPASTSLASNSVPTSPPRKGYVFARQNANPFDGNASTESNIKGKCENTHNVVQWSITNSKAADGVTPAYNTTSVLPTATATEFEIRKDVMLQNKFTNITKMLTPMQLFNGVTTTPTASSQINIGDGTTAPNSVLVDSTTGKITDVAADPEDIISPNPQVVTNGDFTVSLSEPNPYDFGGVTMYNSGNLKYLKRTSQNTYVNAAYVTDTIWRPGATAPSIIGNDFGSFTITQDATGYLTGISANNPPTQRFPSSDIALLQINREDDTYVPPPLTPSEQQDVFDTADEWTTAEFNTLKKWPTNVTPSKAQINYNMPTIVNNSQSGIKYSRSSGFTKWTLDVEYPPMTSEDFKQFHAISLATQGQTIPFYFVLQNKDAKSILWRTSYTPGTTTTPRFKNAITAGDSTALFEGFSAFEAKGMTVGEVFIDGRNHNGSLHTSLNQADANAFGEIKIRTPMPFRDPKSAGSKMYKNPYHVVVTLNSDDFSYRVDTNGYYYVSVAFDLDQWKSDGSVPEISDTLINGLTSSEIATLTAELQSYQASGLGGGFSFSLPMINALLRIYGFGTGN